MSGGAVLTFGGGGRNGGGGMFGGSGPGGKKVGILAGVGSASDVECSEITCTTTETGGGDETTQSKQFLEIQIISSLYICFTLYT